MFAEFSLAAVCWLSKQLFMVGPYIIILISERYKTKTKVVTLAILQMMHTIQWADKTLKHKNQAGMRGWKIYMSDSRLVLVFLAIVIQIQRECKLLFDTQEKTPPTYY